MMINKNKNNKFNQVLRTGDIKSIFKRILISEYFVLYLSILWFLAMYPIIPNIASSGNLNNIFDFMLPLLIVCIGQTFVLLIAGIDLSQTSIIGLCSVVGAVLMTNRVNVNVLGEIPLWGTMINENGGVLANSIWAVPAGVFAMLLVGTLIGVLNGACVSKLKMPAFMVTLVTQALFLNLAIFLTKSNNIMGMPKEFNMIGSGKLGIIPIAFIVAVTLLLFSHLLLSKTILGRWIYAVGTNVKASVVSGVPNDKVIIFAYAFSGFCAALASIIYSGRLEMGRPTLGKEILMDIIGATVIGGTSMFGGKGKVKWTLFGVLFFILLTDVLNLFNLSFFVINIVKGLIILAAALLDVTRTRILAGESNVEKAGA